MSRISLAILCAATVSIARAAPIVIFEHLPEANSPNISHHTVGGPVLADDFDSIVAGGRIVRAEWWGSQAGSSSWELTFHTGVLSGGFGQPGVNPASTGGTKYFVTAVGDDLDGDGIFHYSVALPGTFEVFKGPAPFGSEYWFSVANANSGWTWAYAGAGPTAGDEHWSAVVSNGSSPCGDSGPHCGAWNQLQGRDFAFRLEAVPEPGVWTLVCAGLGCFAIGSIRRKASKSS